MHLLGIFFDILKVFLIKNKLYINYVIMTTSQLEQNIELIQSKDEQSALAEKK